MVAIISDVHGCYNTIKALYDKVRTKYPDIDFYCVGDLVDRGAFSAETIEFCITNNIKVTLGNHDLMFLSYFREPDSTMAYNWQFNGMGPTLKSYSKGNFDFEKHLKFVENLKLFYNTPDCFISHAGISKVYKKYFKDYKLDGSFDMYIENLLKRDIEMDHSVVWERDPLLKLEKLQVVGHTRRLEVGYEESSDTYYIDTGCVYGNKLSCVIVENNRLVEILDEKVNPEDIKTFF